MRLARARKHATVMAESSTGGGRCSALRVCSKSLRAALRLMESRERCGVEVGERWERVQTSASVVTELGKTISRKRCEREEWMKNLKAGLVQLLALMTCE